jgi:hypothetical protein
LGKNRVAQCEGKGRRPFIPKRSRHRRFQRLAPLPIYYLLASVFSPLQTIFPFRIFPAVFPQLSLPFEDSILE